MAGAQSDPQKWYMPGWRIEQRYSNKTLIGNWCEERSAKVSIFVQSDFKAALITILFGSQICSQTF